MSNIKTDFDNEKRNIYIFSKSVMLYDTRILTV